MKKVIIEVEINDTDAMYLGPDVERYIQKEYDAYTCSSRVQHINAEQTEAIKKDNFRVTDEQ